MSRTITNQERTIQAGMEATPEELDAMIVTLDVIRRNKRKQTAAIGKLAAGIVQPAAGDNAGKPAEKAPRRRTAPAAQPVVAEAVLPQTVDAAPRTDTVRVESTADAVEF